MLWLYLLYLLNALHNSSFFGRIAVSFRAQQSGVEESLMMLKRCNSKIS